MKKSGKKPGVGIIGAGRIGIRRAEAIENTGIGVLVAVADSDRKRTAALAGKYAAGACVRAVDLVRRPDVDVVIVAVPNKFTAPAALAALHAGKHVLSEKPLGRNEKEARAILLAARTARRTLAVGFNHRFHAAVIKAKKLCTAGAIGTLTHIRARYGYGGRKGLEKEWRLNKAISGGGELLDQGVHIIDLARYFGEEVSEVFGSTETKFWKTKLDDNDFVLLKNRRVTTWFHASSTNWKNIFSFEIFGTRGYIAIDGKGGSYGTETLTVGRRRKEFGVPDITTETFQGDTSWEEEWKAFCGMIRGRKTANALGLDGYRANYIVSRIYESSRTKRILPVLASRS